MPGGDSGKESPDCAVDAGLIPGSGSSPGGGTVNPPLYSCLGNPVDRGAWQAAVHGVSKSWTQLSVCAHAHVPNTHTHTHDYQLAINLMVVNYFNSGQF